MVFNGIKLSFFFFFLQNKKLKIFLLHSVLCVQFKSSLGWINVKLIDNVSLLSN